MQNDERAAFQKVDVPVILFSASGQFAFQKTTLLMVLIETLGRRFQFIIPSKNVLAPFFGDRFCRTKVRDKAWCVDDSAQTRRIAHDVRANGCELVFTRAPATGREEAFAAGFNCGREFELKETSFAIVSHSF
jgi:hypothetical protein